MLNLYKLTVSAVLGAFEHLLFTAHQLFQTFLFRVLQLKSHRTYQQNMILFACIDAALYQIGFFNFFRFQARCFSGYFPDSILIGGFLQCGFYL